MTFVQLRGWSHVVTKIGGGKGRTIVYDLYPWIPSSQWTFSDFRDELVMKAPLARWRQQSPGCRVHGTAVMMVDTNHARILVTGALKCVDDISAR